MSRIGKQPIPMPEGVEVTVSGTTVTVKGPKGTLERTVSDRVSVEVDDADVIVTRVDDERASRAQHGLFRALIANMVHGRIRGLPEGPVRGRRRLPRGFEGHEPRTPGRLQPSGAHGRSRRHQPSRFRSPPRSRCPESTRSWSARWPPTSARSDLPSPTRARASGTWTSMSAARPVRQVWHDE